jgi:hypothetical protein
MREADRLFERLDVDEKTVASFFIVFSRFEYALKRAGYVCGDNRRVWADWDRFSSKLKDTFEPGKTSELQEAVRYLQDHPPKKQIVKAGRLDWREFERSESESPVQWLLRLVRTVRNNLFHGGKFEFPVQDPSRNAKLLQSCLIVLGACLELCPEVQRRFLDRLE